MLRRLTMAAFALTCLLGHPARAQIDVSSIPAYLAVVGVIRQNACTSPLMAGENLAALHLRLTKALLPGLKACA
jgi:hypothetical protein